MAEKIKREVQIAVTASDQASGTLDRVNKSVRSLGQGAPGRFSDEDESLIQRKIEARMRAMEDAAKRTRIDEEVKRRMFGDEQKAKPAYEKVAQESDKAANGLASLAKRILTVDAAFQFIATTISAYRRNVEADGEMTRRYAVREAFREGIGSIPITGHIFRAVQDMLPGKTASEVDQLNALHLMSGRRAMDSTAGRINAERLFQAGEEMPWKRDRATFLAQRKNQFQDELISRQREGEDLQREREAALAKFANYDGPQKEQVAKDYDQRIRENLRMQNAARMQYAQDVRNYEEQYERQTYLQRQQIVVAGERAISRVRFDEQMERKRRGGQIFEAEIEAVRRSAEDEKKAIEDKYAAMRRDPNIKIGADEIEKMRRAELLSANKTADAREDEIRAMNKRRLRYVREDFEREMQGAEDGLLNRQLRLAGQPEKADRQAAKLEHLQRLQAIQRQAQLEMEKNAQDAPEIRKRAMERARMSVEEYKLRRDEITKERQDMFRAAMAPTFMGDTRLIRGAVGQTRGGTQMELSINLADLAKKRTEAAVKTQEGIDKLVKAFESGAVTIVRIQE